ADAGGGREGAPGRAGGVHQPDLAQRGGGPAAPGRQPGPAGHPSARGILAVGHRARAVPARRVRPPDSQYRAAVRARVAGHPAPEPRLLPGHRHRHAARWPGRLAVRSPRHHPRRRQWRRLRLPGLPAGPRLAGAQPHRRHPRARRRLSLRRRPVGRAPHPVRHLLGRPPLRLRGRRRGGPLPHRQEGHSAAAACRSAPAL
ncbi:MAG: FIG00577962: hypothetical protein, partial [uncultured Chloroflexi bacterium]